MLHAWARLIKDPRLALFAGAPDERKLVPLLLKDIEKPEQSQIRVEAQTSAVHFEKYNLW